MRNLFFLLLLFSPFALFSQNASVEGQVLDSNNNPISYVNVVVFKKGSQTPYKGTATDESGFFIINNLEEGGDYLEFTMIGFTTVSRPIDLPGEINLGKIILIENEEQLEEAIIKVKNPSIKKEQGKLIFNVENTSLSIGNTFDLLKKTPGVLVLGDKIQIKNSEPIIYLNNKRVYLSTKELATLLRSVDASDIKAIEVITNPSAKYDADAGAVLNIITSKAISIGYKGSVNITYEQAVFSKYKFSTSHFYKNDWLNMYANYSFNPRKDFKHDDNYIRFFNPDSSTKSIWESDFEKVSRSKTHQGNVVLDFTLNEKNTLSFSTTVMVSPNKTFDNTVDGEIMNAQRQLDSVFFTNSYLENDKSNLSFNLEHKITLGENQSNLTTSANYINYNSNQTQNLNTDYRLPTGEMLNNINFFTDANQESNIFTLASDFSTLLAEGDFEAGLKYSNIETESGLDFFDIESNTPEYNENLSDLFIYNETIYAGFLNYSKTIDKWELSAGIRGEFTDVEGDSKSLGVINSQDYFDFFPNATVKYSKNENNHFGASYRRSIERPRYQSLNPFTYFVTDNVLLKGNPNLIPTIKNKYLLSYTYKNKWFFEAYYISMKDPMAVLTFQDNENSIIQSLDDNILKDINYSLDIMYASTILPWWYLSVYTSTYYLENEFYALASIEETYSNNTFGFYAQLYSGLTLSKDKTFTSDVTMLYISNMIIGSYDMENQFKLSISFRKTLWDDRVSITAGVDDIFDTNNLLVSSKYYNQDNNYFARTESRLFRLGIKYNFGNSRLRDNNRSNFIDEKKRL